MKQFFIKYKYIILGLIGTFGFSAMVLGNASYFGPTAASAIASSTVQYLAPGAVLATSTPVVYDTYGIDGTNESAGQTSDASDTATLLEYVQASTTASIFVTKIEYSDGVPGVSCTTTPNACDWYENNSETYAAGAIAIVVPNTYTWTYASTTQFGAGTISTLLERRGAKAITFKVPTRYVRAYVVNTGAGGSVYLKWVPKKQRVN